MLPLPMFYSQTLSSIPPRQPSFKSPHQYHSTPLSRPLFSYSLALSHAKGAHPLVLTKSLSALFSYSYALFCHSQNANHCSFNHLRTLCAKHPGWGTRSSRDSLAITAHVASSTTHYPLFTTHFLPETMSVRNRQSSVCKVMPARCLNGRNS